MKRYIFTLLIILMISSLSAQIEGDKGWHFTACAGAFILSDCICEWTNAPRWMPYAFVIGISLGKEFHDPVFNYKDLFADGCGLAFGVLVRL